MKKRVTLALLLSFCTLVPLLAQTPRTDDKDDVVKITTNLVQVDAVVTKDGKPVTNLTADDFEIYEDGRKQAITSFAYISNVSGANVSAANVPAKAEAAPKSDKATTDAPPPPEAVQRDVAHRTIAIVVDDLGLSADSMNQVKKRLRKFIAEELQPNDLVAVIRTGSDVGALQQFTNDKRVLNRALDQLRWNVCSRMGVTVNTAVESVADNTCYYVDSSLRTMKSLRFIVDSMGRLPGRKSMILLSDSMPMMTEEGNSRTPTGVVTDSSERIRTGPTKTDGFGIIQVGDSVRNYGTWLRRISETAIRSSVVIYAVDTQALQYNGITANDAVYERIPQSTPRMNALVFNRTRTMLMNSEGSERLAKQTGGFLVRNSNDFGLDRIVEDQSGYYLLGYRPTEETFNRHFHEVKAKVKRSGMTLRTRFGFYGVSEEEANRGRLSAQDPTTLALISPFAAQDLEVDVNSFFANGKTEGSIIRSFIYLNPARLSFVLNNGQRETALEMRGVIFGDDGKVVEKVKHDIVLSLGENEYQHAMRDGLPDAVRLRFDMPAKRPGSYQVRIAVRDRTSAKIGSAGQFIEVPDLNNNRLALSGIMLRGAGQTAPAAAMANPPDRRFQRNSDLYATLVVYNPRPNLMMQTKLFREGKPVSSNPPVPVEIKEGDSRKLITDVIRLAPELEPGDYYLQVVITDKAAKDKRAAATQWVPFEIVK
jgi:VWFA-related protein